MKKKSFVFIAFLFSALLALSLQSCTEPSKAIVGTWNLDKIEINDQYYSIAEISSNPIYSALLQYTDMTLIFSEDGTVVVKYSNFADTYMYTVNDKERDIIIFDNGDITRTVMILELSDNAKTLELDSDDNYLISLGRLLDYNFYFTKK